MSRAEEFDLAAAELAPLSDGAGVLEDTEANEWGGVLAAADQFRREMHEQPELENN